MTEPSTAKLADVTAIVVAYNSVRVIGECLRGLRGVGRVIVVDNACTDDTQAVVRSALPSAEIVESGYNAGFGRGANLGLEKVATPFAMVVNPDCIGSDGAIEELLAAAQRYPDAALLGPQLSNAAGRPENGFKVPLRDVAEREPPAIAAAGDACSPCLTGAVYLLRMATLREVGFFDPAIFLFYEDDDLCLRIRRAGYSCVLVPDAVMQHAVGQSSSASRRPGFRARFRRWFHFKRSHLYVTGKYHGAAARRVAALKGVGYALPRLLFPSILNYALFVRCCGMLAASMLDLIELGSCARVRGASLRGNQKKK